MNCQECGNRLEVVKTMVLDATTQRLRECDCGARYLTTETVTRRLPMAQVTDRQPPGNKSEQQELNTVNSDPDTRSLPSEATQTHARVERVVFSFQVVGKNPGLWALMQSRHDELVKAFPGVDAMAQYDKIAAWLSANPRKRKTPRGMPAFLFGWFERNQNKPIVQSKTVTESFAERDARLKREEAERKNRERAAEANAWAQIRAERG